MKLSPVVEQHSYPGMVHDLNNPEPNPRRSILGYPVVDDWEASNDSFIRVDRFRQFYDRI